jgi:hypothetical protein
MGTPDQRPKQRDDDRTEARRRYRRLPVRVEPEELVESAPQPPRPEPAYDENIDAVRWYGIPL